MGVCKDGCGNDILLILSSSSRPVILGCCHVDRESRGVMKVSGVDQTIGHR